MAWSTVGTQQIPTGIANWRVYRRLLAARQLPHHASTLWSFRSTWLSRLLKLFYFLRSTNESALFFFSSGQSIGHTFQGRAQQCYFFRNRPAVSGIGFAGCGFPRKTDGRPDLAPGGRSVSFILELSILPGTCLPLASPYLMVTCDGFVV